MLTRCAHADELATPLFYAAVTTLAIIAIACVLVLKVPGLSGVMKACSQCLYGSSKLGTSTRKATAHKSLAQLLTKSSAHASMQDLLRTDSARNNAFIGSSGTVVASNRRLLSNNNQAVDGRSLPGATAESDSADRGAGMDTGAATGRPPHSGRPLRVVPPPHNGRGLDSVDSPSSQASEDMWQGLEMPTACSIEQLVVAAHQFPNAVAHAYSLLGQQLSEKSLHDMDVHKVQAAVVAFRAAVIPGANLLAGGLVKAMKAASEESAAGRYCQAQTVHAAANAAWKARESARLGVEELGRRLSLVDRRG